MKNLIRFLDADIYADSRNIFYFVFWTFFDNEIKLSSNVDQKT